MAREYARVHEYFLQLHELQPPSQHYHHHHPYDPPHLVSALEVTSGGGGAASAANETAGEPLLAAPLQPSHAHAPHSHPLAHAHHHDPRKRKPTNYSSDGYEMSGCEVPITAPPTPSLHSTSSATRKRKLSSYGTGSAYDDDGTDDARSSRSLPDKKQNHSEIEKRRRDKMNTYITELSTLVPMCGAMARKLDKLTVLRLTVQHLRSVRGALTACPLTARPRPSCLSERDLNALILLAAQDSFLLVVGCDRGRLLYVSATVKKMLHYNQSDLLGQSLFDILHPKDVAKVKEQLSSSDLSPRERLIDAKNSDDPHTAFTQPADLAQVWPPAAFTGAGPSHGGPYAAYSQPAYYKPPSTMLPVKADVVAGTSRLCPGARRSFFCRIKCRAQPDAPAAPATDASTKDAPFKEEPEAATKSRKKNSERKYCVVQFTGYLKSWAPAEVCDRGSTDGGSERGSGCETSEDGDACNLSCLVAVGRALPDLAPRAPPPPAPAPASPADPTAPPAPTAPSAPTRLLQYVSRHATDGKFLFVDQRVTLALGFLPQELLGTSLYEYVGGGELGAVARAHKAALLRGDTLLTTPYSFRRKDGLYARIQTHFKPFRNPWTKDVECLVANNTLVMEAGDELVADDAHDFQVFKQKAEGDMQRLIDTQLESHKIGSAIAEEALRRSSPEFSSDLPTDLLQDVVFNNQCLTPNAIYEHTTLVDNILGVEGGGESVEGGAYQVRNNVPLSAAGARGSPAPDSGAQGAPASPPVASPPLPPLGIDGNGEAAMAVIMSLLEADAGLGGPVNFSSLPWPLP